MGKTETLHNLIEAIEADDPAAIIKSHFLEDAKRELAAIDGIKTEWSGSCDPCDPANFWIDDETGERVNAITGERSQHQCE